MRWGLSLILSAVFAASSAFAQTLQPIAQGAPQGSGSKFFAMKLRNQPGTFLVTGPQELSTLIHQSVLAGTSDRFAVIDLREKADFERGHIQGAINWPVANDQTAINAAVAQIKMPGRTGIPENVKAVMDRTLVFHCQSSAFRTPQIASAFAQKFATPDAKVAILDQGFAAFEAFDSQQPVTQKLISIGAAAREAALARVGAEDPAEEPAVGAAKVKAEGTTTITSGEEEKPAVGVPATGEEGVAVGGASRASPPSPKGKGKATIVEGTDLEGHRNLKPINLRPVSEPGSPKETFTIWLLFASELRKLMRVV